MLSQGSQVRSSDEGNTNLRHRSRCWCFTLNNYTEKELSQCLNYFESKKFTFIVGKELGECGTPHLQGYLKNKNQISFSTLQKALPRAHLEAARGDQQENYVYCSKGGDFTTNITVKKTPNVLAKPKITPRDWQTQVIDLIEKEPDARRINWFYDAKGNNGKTTLCDHIISEYEDVMYFTGGKATDICSQALLHDEDGKGLKVCLFDFTRTCEGKVSYASMEALKNGLINSPKYKGGSLRLDYYPIIIVFANFKPDLEKLSGDRWNVIEIESQEKA